MSNVLSWSIYKCRVCLEVGEIPIYGDKLKADISADVIAFGDIKISINDNFPKFLCNDCYKQLQAAITFRNTAKHSELILKQTKYDTKSGSDIPNGKYISTYDSNIPPKREHNSISNETSDNKQSPNVSRISEQELNLDNVKCSENIKISYEDNNANVESSKEDTISTNCQDENDSCIAQLSFSMNEKNAISNKTCKICNIDFYSSKEFKKHNESVDHKKAKQHFSKIKCEICCKKLSKPYYKQHLALHGKDLGSKAMKRECPICKKLYSKTYYKDHLTRAHSTENKKPKPQIRIQCSVCNKSYEKQYYKFHLAIHNEGLSKYICDTCGKSFIQQSAFKRHRLIHGSELAFKCPHCPYRGRHPGLVKTHVRTHTRDYQYECIQCSARFLTKSNLNKHMQRHKGPVDFKCDTCKRGFYSKLELERHFEADHLGVKNHVCNMCGKAFGYRNAMMNHQLKVHKRAKLTNGKGRQPLYLEAERKKLDVL